MMHSKICSKCQGLKQLTGISFFKVNKKGQSGVQRYNKRKWIQSNLFEQNGTSKFCFRCITQVIDTFFIYSITIIENLSCKSSNFAHYISGYASKVQ